MIFRLVMLLVVAFLGCVVYYSRKVPEPLDLLKVAAVRTLVVCLWTVGTFGVMTLIEVLWIDK